MSMFILWICLIISCGHLRMLNAASSNDAMLSQSVLLTFSNVSLNTWHLENKTLILSEILANLSTVHCKTNHDNCGVSGATSTRFKSENVKTVSSYPKKKNNNLETLLYVEIPTNDGSIPSKLPGGTLITIITHGKSTLSSGIGFPIDSIEPGQTGSNGTKVDNKLNTIMIPVAFFLLLAIALVAWILHRGKKKKKAKEERKRYSALQNSKNATNASKNTEAMVNTADVPPTQFSGQSESGHVMPELDTPENQAEYEVNNNNKRRHKKRRALPRKPPIRRAPTDESDDVFDDDTNGREKPKKKGRRRKGRRSYDVNRDELEDEEYEMRAAEELACSQASSEGTNGESHVNTGYQRDSEKGESDPSRTDSAVELSSSVASSANQNRARNLPPIPRASQNEK